MSNIGQLLHKLTKYQTLYSFVADEAKRAVYEQKIAYYKQALEKAGIDQNNINGVQNLVGGEPKEEYKNSADTLIARLFPPEQTELSEEHKTSLQSVTDKISDASNKIDVITSTYTDIFETIKYIIEQIKNKMKTSGHVPISQISDEIISKLTELEGKISTLNGNITKEKFTNILKQSYSEAAAQPAAASPKRQPQKKVSSSTA